MFHRKNDSKRVEPYKCHFGPYIYILKWLSKNTQVNFTCNKNVGSLYNMKALLTISLDNLQNRITVYFILFTNVQTGSKKKKKNTAVNWLTFYKTVELFFTADKWKKKSILQEIVQF